VKTFEFATTPVNMDEEGVVFAIEKMAEASKQIVEEGVESGKVFVSVITEDDLVRVVNDHAQEAAAILQNDAMRRQLIAIVIALAKKHGGGVRITQSELDETKGWNLRVGPVNGMMQVEVTTPTGILYRPM
jgi:KaiC/GvpD/RAD55 family RecA-like ATPase